MTWLVVKKSDGSVVTGPVAAAPAFNEATHDLLQVPIGTVWSPGVRGFIDEVPALPLRSAEAHDDYPTQEAPLSLAQINALIADYNDLKRKLREAGLLQR